MTIIYENAGLFRRSIDKSVIFFDEILFFGQYILPYVAGSEEVGVYIMK